MIRGTPVSCCRTARVSSRVRTTGRYWGRLARTTSSSHGRSTPSTSRYRKSNALSAWFWVEAATLSRTASEDRNAEISAGPISAGCRLSWKKMNRRIQWT
jgi:hypothetical protein